ncbi:hypothetical protein cyc_02366 [Cyclospora cayetanensis]|uniref:Uncharacterized protein n=1 Tax=Cyclospora cayetanensis TaxID=88456 RepID=A0A1D3D8F1_9EIME|nr:hypothetical protein cyc_02366 [Cyclospora cayetanensis]
MRAFGKWLKRIPFTPVSRKTHRPWSMRASGFNMELWSGLDKHSQSSACKILTNHRYSLPPHNAQIGIIRYSTQRQVLDSHHLGSSAQNQQLVSGAYDESRKLHKDVSAVRATDANAKVELLDSKKERHRQCLPPKLIVGGSTTVQPSFSITLADCASVALKRATMGTSASMAGYLPPEIVRPSTPRLSNA